MDQTATLSKKKILVAITGSIAAVKAPILISRLIKAGAEVRCVLTQSASKLVSPLSLSTLSRNRCYEDKDQWDPRQERPLHIELAEWADLIAIAPLSASSLSRWVNGLSEGLAASVLLASERPVIAAAAMNTGMWNHPVTEEHLDKLEKWGFEIIRPISKVLMCGEVSSTTDYKIQSII